MITRRLMAAMALGLAMTAPATAHDFAAEGIAVAHPWSRPAVKGGVAGGFFTLTNTGEGILWLTGLESRAAERAEIHVSVQENGVSAMRQVENGMAIAPGQTIVFGPGGHHVMFFGMAEAVGVGDRFPARLSFRRAGREQSLDVEFAVEAPGAHH